MALCHTRQAAGCAQNQERKGKGLVPSRSLALSEPCLPFKGPPPPSPFPSSPVLPGSWHPSAAHREHNPQREKEGETAGQTCKTGSKQGSVVALSAMGGRNQYWGDGTLDKTGARPCMKQFQAQRKKANRPPGQSQPTEQQEVTQLQPLPQGKGSWPFRPNGAMKSCSLTSCIAQGPRH